MKVNVYGKLIDLKIDYRFNKADADSIKSAIENNGVIRHITRIKIYQNVLKNIKLGNKYFMCNAIYNCIYYNFDTKILSHYNNILPEFNKNNYRNLIHPTYPKDGVAWDWEGKDNRIKFLEAIKRQCAVEYLSLRKY